MSSSEKADAASPAARSRMRALAGELRAHWWLWLGPIALYYGGLVWLAWRAAHVPTNPFTYDF
jgi:hypothetical protein